MNAFSAVYPATLDSVQKLLITILGLRDGDFTRGAETRLLGHFAELDSMAAISILTALEEQFGIQVEDDDISGSTFETLGSLAAYVQDKLNG